MSLLFRHCNLVGVRAPTVYFGVSTSVSLHDRSSIYCFVFATVFGLTNSQLIQTANACGCLFQLLLVALVLVGRPSLRACLSARRRRREESRDEDEDTGVLPAAAAGLQRRHGPGARQ
jgi:hypothetical protein